MTSFVFNFLKRALIIPLALAAVVTVAVVALVPKYCNFNNESAGAYTVQALDLSQYEVEEYTAFSELDGGALVGGIKSDSVGFGENAIINNSSENGSIRLSKVSTEPWNNGAVVLIGKNTENGFKSLHQADVGDTLTLNCFSNGEYSYKITDIKTNLTESELEALAKENTLVAAVSYNDFSKLGESFFYTAFIAEAE